MVVWLMCPNLLTSNKPLQLSMPVLGRIRSSRSHWQFDHHCFHVKTPVEPITEATQTALGLCWPGHSTGLKMPNSSELWGVLQDSLRDSPQMHLQKAQTKRPK
jgi:hypothetical protein